MIFVILIQSDSLCFNMCCYLKAMEITDSTKTVELA